MNLSSWLLKPENQSWWFIRAFESCLVEEAKPDSTAKASKTNWRCPLYRLDIMEKRFERAVYNKLLPQVELACGFPERQFELWRVHSIDAIEMIVDLAQEALALAVEHNV